MTFAFEASASYGQIAVFRIGATAFPYWREEHLPQGFAMTDDAVSFLLPEHEGSMWIETDVVGEGASLPRAAIRAIEVPFPVGASGAGLSGLDGDVELPVAPGAYRLRYVLLPGRAVNGAWMSYVVLLQFMTGEPGPATILVRDEEITAAELLLTAPAPA